MALSYGKPSSLAEDECDVDMINDLDGAAPCPGFQSMEHREDVDGPRSVTLLSYQRYKYRLYMIATPIAKTIYFLKGASVTEVVDKVRNIHQKLVELNSHIPPELRLDSFRNIRADDEPDPILKTFQLQALTLQLSYDNIQLHLHRPLLAYATQLPRPLPVASSERNNGEPDHSRRSDAKAVSAMAGDTPVEFSRKQCWNSAIHTSQIGQYPIILRMARNTHAASYIGIQAFTAGVMLAMFALRDPSSEEAREAKAAIAHLIKTPKVTGLRTHVFTQSGRILQGLLRLILAEELKSLVSDDMMDQGFTSGTVTPSLNPMLRHPPVLPIGMNTQGPFRRSCKSI